ncbi:MAG: hypothetical protein IJ026_01870 [Candidatus Methanomethylophilaceae archaeon]|nr:hypothetical protein [Candidatus Methanomethylophilaceae archaeon]
MYGSEKTVVASVALCGVLGAIAFLFADWMWFLIDVLCIVMLLVPYRRDLGYRYHDRIVRLTLLGPILAIVFAILYQFSDIEAVSVLETPGYMYMTAGIQSYQCYLLGFMFALVMDRSYGLRMTAPWLIVFSLTFTMMMSAVDMFFTFGLLYFEGYPVFNEDFVDTEIYTNGLLMIPPMAATIVSAVLSAILYRRLSVYDKSHYLVTEGSQ